MSVLRDDSSHSSPSFSSSENPSPCALPPSNSNVPRLSFPFGDDYVSCSDSPPSCMRNRERPPEEVEDNPSKKKITFSFSSPPIFTRTRNDSCPPLPEICRVPPSTPPPTTKSKSIVKTHSNEIVPGEHKKQIFFYPIFLFSLLFPTVFLFSFPRASTY